MNQTLIETPARFRSELRHALTDAASAAQARPAVHAPEPALRRRGRVRLVRRIAPGVALAVIAAVAVLALSSGGGVGPQTASAASVLRASADALERQAPSWALGPGEYFYRRFAVWFRELGWPQHRTVVVKSVYQTWTARNGAGRSQEHVLDFVGPRYLRHSVLGRGYDDKTRPSRKPFLLGLGDFGVKLSYSELRKLPTDSAALGRYVDQVASRLVRAPLAKGFDRTQLRTAVIFQITRSLGEVPATAGVRAAIYRLLAATPGIRLLGRTEDAVGREGVALEARVGLYRFVVIVDPGTGMLLQSSRSLVHRTPLMPGYPAGLINRSTTLQTGVVRSTHSIP